MNRNGWRSGPVRTGLGDFGRTCWRQARHMQDLRLAALCDQEGVGVLPGLAEIGTAPAAIQFCDTVQKAQAAMRDGKVPLGPDGKLLAALDLDVIVEASGSPEAGAVHGLAALDQGKHVVMVNKETACTVGPTLAAAAAARGLHYGMADGDQPRQILDMLDWAETLGLEVVCAGKAGEADYPAGAADVDIWALAADESRMAEMARQRSRHIPLQHRAGVADLAELAIVLNEKDLGWDLPGLHAPVMYYREMPSILRPQADGGILIRIPVVEVANLLSHPWVPSMAGELWFVVMPAILPPWPLLALTPMPTPSATVPMCASQTIRAAGQTRQARPDMVCGTSRIPPQG